jgi:hypothetical protein
MGSGKLPTFAIDDERHSGLPKRNLETHSRFPAHIVYERTKLPLTNLARQPVDREADIVVGIRRTQCPFRISVRLKGWQLSGRRCATDAGLDRSGQEAMARRTW